MCNQIADRSMMCWNLTLEKLYHHLFSTLGQPRAIFDHLKHDLVLWLNHHSYEGLPDALEYYLVDPNSDLDDDLTKLDILRSKRSADNHPYSSYHDHLHPPRLGQVFSSHLWEYPGLYDLLDTPRPVFLALKLHLHPDLEAPYPLK